MASRRRPAEPPRQTAQDLLLDALLRHQIGVLRRSSAIRNQLLALLDDTEADLRASIRDRLRHHTGTGSPANVARLEKLLADVEQVRGTAWAAATPVLVESMREIVAEEPRLVSAIVRTVVPVRLEPTLPAPAQLRALVTERPFEGRLLRDWARKIRRDDVERIHGQVRIGIVRGEGAADIARRVVGTVRLRGRNGATEVTRRDAAALVRTAANHFANQARQQWVAANPGLVGRELYVATLDVRTTPVCGALDGEVFPAGEGPVPPVHYSCRSTRVPIIDGEAIGERPAKPVTERMLLREFAGREGLRAPARRADLPRGTRGRFDDFARARTRELVGQVPARTTYQEFLARQSREFQDDVLGPTRARLFRSGGLTLDKFVDRDGSSITLAELATMHARAFRAAGLDPENFF